jgi:hypothetical protein
VVEILELSQINQVETDYHNYQLPKNTGNKRESGADYISGNEGNAQNALSIISRKINA